MMAHGTQGMPVLFTHLCPVYSWAGIKVF